MKARWRGPEGSGLIEMPDDTPLSSLLDELKIRSGVANFSLKYGPPMAMKDVDSALGSESVGKLGLNGQVLTIVPKDADVRGQSLDAALPPSRVPDKGASSETPEDINIAWPEREGTLLLRVMPSDNSCLFTAFGGALPQQIPAQRLRRMMAEYIQENGDVYSEAVLGTKPELYCQSIQDPDRWGGGIELSILSAIFNLQICTFDVQSQTVMNFGESKKERCILLYSGIHYDRVAFSYSDFPHTFAALPPEMDRTIWPVEDDQVLEKTQELVRKLNVMHYYTDPDGLVLKCDIPGCNWIGSGQFAGSKHAEETGHVELSEITDIETDGVLRKCAAPGCTFMAQGDKLARQHTIDTGHAELTTIPDF